MGSAGFEAWPYELEKATRWAQHYPVPKNGADLSHLLGAGRYHSLPMAFERHRFVIPKTLPPWCTGPFDEAFFVHTVPDFFGSPFCLEEARAERWRKTFLQNRGYRVFAKGRQIEPPRVGWPRKRDEALEYFDKLYPNGDRPSWKEVCQDIQTAFTWRLRRKRSSEP